MTAQGILAPVRPCIKCGATDRNKMGGCKVCARASSSAWYAANPDKQKARSAAWKAANADKVKANKAAWAEANPDKVKASDAAYRANNQKKVKESAAAWRAANPDMKKACEAAWKAANPEIIKIHRQNRRARKKKADGKLSSNLAPKLFKLQKGKCPCCAQPLGEDFHLDHKMPLFLGGSNTDDNMQLLRKHCNLQKNSKHPVDFMRSRGFLL